MFILLIILRENSALLEEIIWYTAIHVLHELRGGISIAAEGMVWFEGGVGARETQKGESKKGKLEVRGLQNQQNTVIWAADYPWIFRVLTK